MIFVRLALCVLMCSAAWGETSLDFYLEHLEESRGGSEDEIGLAIELIQRVPKDQIIAGSEKIIGALEANKEIYLASRHNIHVVIGEFYHARHIFPEGEVKRLTNLALPFIKDEDVASMVAIFVTQQDTLRFAESEKAGEKKSSNENE